MIGDAGADRGVDRARLGTSISAIAGWRHDGRQSAGTADGAPARPGVPVHPPMVSPRDTPDEAGPAADPPVIAKESGVMAEENRPGDRGPTDEGNGGPVTPGAEAPRGGAHGTGSNGNGSGEPTTVIKREDGPGLRGGRISGLWVGLTLSAVVLIFLLIFIVQNGEPTEIRFLGLVGTLPVGVALLFAAALGVLLVAIPGYGRILQLRRAARKRGVR